MNSSVDSEPDPSRSLKHVYSYFYTCVHTFYTYVHTFTHCHSIDNACMRRPRNSNYFLYFEHRASDYLWIYGKICKFSLNCHYKILKKNLKDYLVIKKLTKIPWLPIFWSACPVSWSLLRQRRPHQPVNFLHCPSLKFNKILKCWSSWPFEVWSYQEHMQCLLSGISSNFP